MTADPAYLQVGRVVLQGTKFQVRRRDNGLDIEGHCITGESFETGSLIARAWESDLKAHSRENDLVAVHWDRRSEFDGFYRVASAAINTWQPYANYEFALSLDYALPGRWSNDDLRFESQIQGAVKTNDHSITTASATLMPPPHSVYEPTHASTVTRDVAYHGAQTVYRSIDITSDPPIHPRWNAKAEDYMIGAARIARRDPMWPQNDPVAGESVNPGDTEDYGLDNGIARFHISDHKPVVEFWDGAQWVSHTLAFNKGGVPFTDWNKISIVSNTFERCVLRYEGGDNGRMGAYVSQRRGERGVSCVLDSDTSTTLGVFEVTPSNMNVSAPRMIHSSAGPNGHKLMYVSTRTFNSTAADASMYKTSTKRFDVGITAELSGAAAGNLAADLQAQYFAAVRETTTVL